MSRFFCFFMILFLFALLRTGLSLGPDPCNSNIDCISGTRFLLLSHKGREFCLGGLCALTSCFDTVECKFYNQTSYCDTSYCIALKLVGESCFSSEQCDCVQGICANSLTTLDAASNPDSDDPDSDEILGLDPFIFYIIVAAVALFIVVFMILSVYCAFKAKRDKKDKAAIINHRNNSLSRVVNDHQVDGQQAYYGTPEFYGTDQIDSANVLPRDPPRVTSLKRQVKDDRKQSNAHSSLVDWFRPSSPSGRRESTTRSSIDLPSSIGPPSDLPPPPPGKFRSRFNYN